MKPNLIGIKSLHGNLARVATAVGKGQSFIVMKHAKPMFRIEPVAKPQEKTLYTIDDVRRLSFKGKRKNMSRMVDTDVYGL